MSGGKLLSFSEMDRCRPLVLAIRLARAPVSRLLYDSVEVSSSSYELRALESGWYHKDFLKIMKKYRGCELFRRSAVDG